MLGKQALKLTTFSGYMTNYILQFLLFAFLGWIIDSTACTITSKKLVWSGYFKGIPLCPVYGFGGILLFGTFSYLRLYPWWFVIPMASLLVILVEYISGVIAVSFFKERLWDYSNEYLNIDGHISLYHSILWVGLVTVLYFFFRDFIFYILDIINGILVLPRYLDGLIFLTVILLIIPLTLQTRKFRLQKLKTKKR